MSTTLMNVLAFRAAGGQLEGSIRFVCFAKKKKKKKIKK